MKVYTKTGDQGLTGLLGGTRISKADARIDLYGEVDSLNSIVGLLVSNLDSKTFSSEIAFLEGIQSRLFDLGSLLACESEKRSTFKLPEIEEELVKALESAMDKMHEDLPELKNFILPGGSSAASCAHICRTSCRRLERQIIAIKDQDLFTLPDNSVTFLNRLSDYFFVLARHLNLKLNIEEKIWQKGAITPMV